MAHIFKSLRNLAYTALLLGMVATVACSGVPAASVENSTVTSGAPRHINDAHTQASQASWPLAPDRMDTESPVPPSGPSANDSEGATSEIDADAVVAAFEQVIGNVHNTVLPSVVTVLVVNRVEFSRSAQRFTPPFPFGQAPPQGNTPAPENDFYYSNGQGSGFVWDKEGHIVTNRHVVVDAERILLVFSDGSEAEAEVVGADEDSDLAVLKVERDADLLHPVSLGDSNDVRVGQIAITLGNPFGQDFSTTTGIVSAIGRTIRSRDSHFSVPKVIQTDASMNPGNSGGPLLDRKGRVVGIDAQIITRSGANTGIGFAIPINIAKQVVPALIDDGVFTYSWLGIRGSTIGAEAIELMGAPEGTRGALVIAMAEGGPAQNAGLVGSNKAGQTDDGSVRYGGDVITAIDDTAIDGMNDLIIYLLENTRPGETVTMSLVRDGGESQQIEVTLGARPQPLN